MVAAGVHVPQGLRGAAGEEEAEHESEVPLLTMIRVGIGRHQAQDQSYNQKDMCYQNSLDTENTAWSPEVGVNKNYSHKCNSHEKIWAPRERKIETNRYQNRKSFNKCWTPGDRNYDQTRKHYEQSTYLRRAPWRRATPIVSEESKTKSSKERLRVASGLDPRAEEQVQQERLA